MSSENIIYRDDKEYPKLLKEIGKTAPKQLYYKGNWPIASGNQRDLVPHAKGLSPLRSSIFDNCLAVVGSRRLTSYGKEAAERIVGEVALAGITIVSGFMYGGDAVAHNAAVRVGGRTIAVMPCGIDRIHPEYQKDLYNQILEGGGLIISEYKGDMQPVLWTYPQRNRIVAGLSQAVLVLEAGEKSGSLITANLAKKFGRKIFALPGPVGSKLSQGTNRLIKEGVAEMVLSSSDILRYFDSIAPKKLERQRDLVPYAKGLSPFRSSSNSENKILEELGIEPLRIDELSRGLGISVAELGVKLTMMEIRRIIKQEGGKYYVCKD